MKNLKFYLFAILMVITVCSCEDDKTVDPSQQVNQELQGEWDVYSFTADGEEFISYSINSFVINFNCSKDCEGRSKWTLIYTDGSSQRYDYDYEVYNDGNSVTIDGTKYTISFNGSELQLSGNRNGYKWIIEAEK
nr:hypothetical protein [uncultured Carboxylicivirga sp.]